MEGIIAAILMTVFFSCGAPVWKVLRNKGVSTKAVMATSGFTVPAWVVLGYVISKQATVQWSGLYLLVVVSWVFLVVVRHLMALYLFRYKALTEMGAYGLAFTLITSLIIDFFFFGIMFASKTLLAFAFFIAAGLCISYHRSMFGKNKVSIKLTLLVLFMVSILNASFFAIYKVGLQMQDHILLHVAISQILYHTTVFVLGFKDLRKSMASGKLKVKHILFVNTFLILGVLAEGYALDSLPISIIVLTTLIPMIVFAIFDLTKKEVKVDNRTIAAVILIIIGILLISL